MHLPVEDPIYHGFYIIRKFPRYAIARDSTIINRETGECLGCYLTTGGYLSVNLYYAPQKSKSVRVHRLLMETFYPCEDMDILVVDHLNSNPRDNRLENLEWVTVMENVQRASRRGRMSQFKVPVETLNPYTGERTWYESKSACAKALGLSYMAMRPRLLRGDHIVYPEGLQYRYASDEPWEPTENPDKAKAEALVDKPLALKNLDTGEERIFSTTAEAMKFLGKTPSYFTRLYRLNNKQPLLAGGWLAKRINDNEPWRECNRWEEWLAQSKQHTVIEVFHSPNIYRFECFQDAARQYGLTEATAYQRAKTAGKSLFKDGTRWAYYPILSDLLSADV